MMPLLLALAAASAANPRFDACAKLAATDPAAAVEQAEAWRREAGGLLPRQCLGLAYVALGRWAPAALAFEQAAKEAEIVRDGRAATLWVQAGNTSLAGDDPAKARLSLDRALAMPVMADPMRGEAYMDRARAGVALGDLAAARADLDRAVALVPADPMGWLLSATLARRQGDGVRAAKDIAEAVRLAPDDAAVAYEQGNVAAAGDGDPAPAWTRAVRLAPNSDPGMAAKAALAQAAAKP